MVLVSGESKATAPRRRKGRKKLFHRRPNLSTYVDRIVYRCRQEGWRGLMDMRGWAGLAVVVLGMLAAPALAQQPGSTAPPAGFAEAARAAIQRRVDAGEFSGAVLVMRDGKP